MLNLAKLNLNPPIYGPTLPTPEVPASAVTKQVKAGNLSGNPAVAKGLLASAGQSRKFILRKIMKDFPPTSSWVDGFLYAHWTAENPAIAAVVLELQGTIAFALLGEYEVVPSEFVAACIRKYGLGLPGLPGLKRAIDHFSNDNDGTFTKGLFKKIYNDTKRMPHWKQHFASADAVMEAVRAGKKLRIAWWDDGMVFVSEYVK